MILAEHVLMVVRRRHISCVSGADLLASDIKRHICSRIPQFAVSGKHRSLFRRVWSVRLYRLVDGFGYVIKTFWHIVDFLLVQRYGINDLKVFELGNP